MMNFGETIAALKAGKLVPWLASQTDVLAEDWVEVWHE